MKTKIPPETLLAYERTLYWVKASPKAWTLRLGRRSPRLASLYRQENLSTSAFLTAYNPYSQKTSKTKNILSQKRLVEDVRKKGFSFIPGVGEDPKGQWASEVSLLVLGLNLNAAKSLGNKYRQNALVFTGKNAIPRLILLR
jgi:hypothetical protein